MDWFYGFDLGDAESAVARLEKDSRDLPEVLEIREEKSIITAYALLKNGDVLIGEGACYDPDALERKIRFKSKFLTDESVVRDVKSFAGALLGELYLSGDLIKGLENCFYVGCPAGWSNIVREDYRLIFEKLGYPPVKVISESRAALVSACQSKYLQVGYDILSRPVLVVDIGSSTTDFAYIMSGKEVELQTGGEVFLGGGVMDEILLEESIKNSPDAKRIHGIFSESESWRSYCEFAARRVKEQYFSDPDFWQDKLCTKTILIREGMVPARLTLKVDEHVANEMLNQKVERLGNKSFHEVFSESLKEARDAIGGKQPELLFLTGGVSKMKEIRHWCAEVFPEAVIVSSSEPEFSVARGLAYCGKIDEELRLFKEDIDRLISSTVVEKIVADHSEELYRAAIDTLIEPIIRNTAVPVISRWRNGEIEKLNEIDSVLAKEIDAYMHTDEARTLLARPVGNWLKTIAYSLEEHTMPICARHNVPYSALNLNSYLSVNDFDVQVDAKQLLPVEELTWLVDALVSILIGFLCGGSGVALIANGLPGILAGAVLSMLVLLLGKEKMQVWAQNMSIPHPVRKLFPMSMVENRIDKMAMEAKAKMFEKLEEGKNDEITERLVREISQQIESCLTKMAEVVEIPIG